MKQTPAPRNGFRRAAVSALLLFGLAHPAGVAGEVEGDGETPPAIRIEVEEARTRVGPALVRLRISDLSFEKNRLEGDYAVEIPWVRSKNDNGHLSLVLPLLVDGLLDKGGLLKGEGVSSRFPDDPPRLVRARLAPPEGGKEHGSLLVTIQTTERVLHFETRYRVVPEEGEESP